VEKGKQVLPEEVVGVTGIYRKLKTLNKEVRQGADSEVYMLSVSHTSNSY